MTKPTGKFDPTGKALCVWEDYVAGTDPTNTNDMFSATVTLVNGKPTISCSPELPAEQSALRTYTTYGKASLTDTGWSVVKGDAEKYNFFKVTVEMKPTINQ